MDNYITLDECEDFVIWLFPEKELQAIHWVTLSDVDKQIYLNRVCNLFNTLKFKGYKVDINQDLEFPRIINENTVGVTERIKKCLSYMTVKLIASDLDKREQLQASGVVEIKIDKLTEKFSTQEHVKTDIKLLKDNQVRGYLKGVIQTNGLVMG